MSASDEPLTDDDIARIDEMLLNFSEKHVRCPYCGHEHDPDSGGLLYDEENTGWEWECESCDEEFDVDVRASFTWQTSKLERP